MVHVGGGIGAQEMFTVPRYSVLRFIVQNLLEVVEDGKNVRAFTKPRAQGVLERRMWLANWLI